MGMKDFSVLFQTLNRVVTLKLFKGYFKHPTKNLGEQIHFWKINRQKKKQESFYLSLLMIKSQKVVKK